MKTNLLPVYFSNGDEEELNNQINTLKKSLGDIAEFLPLTRIDQIDVKGDVDGILFPQLTGEIYSNYHFLLNLNLPLLIITSEYNTMAMWDWEISSYLKIKGLKVFAPYSLRQAQVICSAMAAKRTMKDANFLVYQDTPGDGQQASIFKRFFWWEKECIDNIKNKFGISIIINSFKKFCEEAEQISTDTIKSEWEKRKWPVDVDDERLYRSLNIYVQTLEELAKHKNVVAVGSNCLNESFYSNTTPCLAWDMLFQDKGIIWGCEGDITLMMTTYLLHSILEKPFMMTNIYPFLMGQTACRHEKIDNFPDIPGGENHALCAHCGYFGIVSRKHATRWTVKPKVLDIVDEKSIAIDAELPTGDYLMLKLAADMQKLYVSESKLKEYIQFPGSHARNTALLEVKNGHNIMKNLPSHHIVLLHDSSLAEIEIISEVFNLDLAII